MRFRRLRRTVALLLNYPYTFFAKIMWPCTEVSDVKDVTVLRYTGTWYECTVQGVLVAQWQLEPKPKAVMTAVDPEPVDRGDGARVQRWQTTNGVIHAQVIYMNGRVEWYLQVKP